MVKQIFTNLFKHHAEIVIRPGDSIVESDGVTLCFGTVIETEPVSGWLKMATKLADGSAWEHWTHIAQVETVESILVKLGMSQVEMAWVMS